MIESIQRIGPRCVWAAAFATLLGASAAEAQYVPPVGIPAPTFGIEQSHNQYAGRTFAPGGFVYRNAGAGPYSHYVDRSAGCSDSNNTYGTAAQPRCSIPGSLPAGSVVEVHGTGYAGATWSASGTAANPVFIRGVGVGSKPRFDSEIRINGTYTIVEYIEVLGGRVWLESDFSVLRHSHVHHNSSQPGALVLVNGSNTVVYRNQVNNITGGDRHGVQPGGGITNVWILENTIFECQGDAVQFCHGCIGTGNGPANVYIGRNTMYAVTTGENAIDIKETRGPVIISQNEMYGYQDSTHSNGEALRINNEGDQGEIWVIGNRIHDSLHAIQPQRHHSTGVYILANILYNLTGHAIREDAGYVYDNTIYNVGGTGIQTGTEVRNNIVMNAGTNIGDGVVTCSHNLLFESIGGIISPSKCGSSQTVANPLFFNPGVGDFRLQATSPARNSGVTPSPYQTFQSKYGRSISFDAGGAPRPQEGAWDRGAYEFGGGQTSAPAPPTSLRIIR